MLPIQIHNPLLSPTTRKWERRRSHQLTLTLISQIISAPRQINKLHLLLSRWIVTGVWGWVLESSNHVCEGCVHYWKKEICVCKLIFFFYLEHWILLDIWFSSQFIVVLISFIIAIQSTPQLQPKTTKVFPISSWLRAKALLCIFLRNISWCLYILFSKSLKPADQGVPYAKESTNNYQSSSAASFGAKGNASYMMLSLAILLQHG